MTIVLSSVKWLDGVGRRFQDNSLIFSTQRVFGEAPQDHSKAKIDHETILIANSYLVVLFIYSGTADLFDIFLRLVPLSDNRIADWMPDSWAFMRPIRFKAQPIRVVIA